MQHSKKPSPPVYSVIKGKLTLIGQYPMDEHRKTIDNCECDSHCTTIPELIGTMLKLGKPICMLEPRSQCAEYDPIDAFLNALVIYAEHVALFAPCQMYIWARSGDVQLKYIGNYGTMKFIVTDGGKIKDYHAELKEPNVATGKDFFDRYGHEFRGDIHEEVINGKTILVGYNTAMKSIVYEVNGCRDTIDSKGLRDVTFDQHGVSFADVDGGVYHITVA